jgi:hypothetical protein
MIGELILFVMGGLVIALLVDTVLGLVDAAQPGTPGDDLNATCVIVTDDDVADAP